MNGAGTSRQDEAGQLSTVDLIDRLSRFQGPPEEFLANLLATQCHLAGAAGGAILRMTPERRAEIIAVFPALGDGATAPVWLAQSVEWAPQALAGGATAVKPLQMPDQLYGAPAGRHLVMVPLRGGEGVRGLAAFVLETDDPAVLAAGRERLELTVSLLSLYEMRLSLYRRQKDLSTLRQAMDTLAAVNEHDRFTASAMGICNELAARWGSERDALGVLQGRYVHLKGLSHTEKFSRKMKLVQEIEAAMEECLDQDLEIVHPADREATYVSRAAAEMSSRHGLTSVVSLPLRRGGAPVAVLTAERQADRPFLGEEIEGLRLTCDLCTPRLVSLHEHDRWLGARAAAGTRKGLSGLLGPRHTWAKLLAILVFAAAMFLIFAKGQYRVEAPFVVQAVQRRVVSPPFDGELEDVFVERGQAVTRGQKLAKLRTWDLERDLHKAEKQLFEYEKQAESATAQRKWADAQIATAGANRLRLEVQDLKEQIGKATIASPIEGTVVVGDLAEQIGAVVKTGNKLFEVAQLGELRAELSVSEDQIADVAEGMGGELATEARPGDRVRFVVDRIAPAADLVDKQNVFKVRVRLLSTPRWLGPDREGIAKITVGRRPYGAIWTRRLVNWVRMKLWM